VFVFSNVSDSYALIIKNTIKEAIQDWELRVQIVNITVDPD
jgi:phage baseplate assembly protein W